MSTIIEPIGRFQILVFRTRNTDEDPMLPSEDSDDYSVNILTDENPPMSVTAWIEATACMSAYIARHSEIGYEKTLEIITARTMDYRDDVRHPPGKKSTNEPGDNPEENEGDLTP